MRRACRSTCSMRCVPMTRTSGLKQAIGAEFSAAYLKLKHQRVERLLLAFHASGSATPRSISERGADDCLNKLMCRDCPTLRRGAALSPCRTAKERNRPMKNYVLTVTCKSTRGIVAAISELSR